MDEQQTNEGLLCDADRKLIASAARLQKYVEAPVPAGLLGELSDDLLKLAFIPYASRSKLSSLYGPGLDFMSLVSADWREAFSQGALRMHNAKTISFPTHIEMANGEAVELSISENAQEGGPAWFLSYVEKKDDLLFDGSRTLQRDVDHILLDNIDRLPKAFLAEELRGADDAIEALDKTMHAEDDTSRRAAYDELREAVEDNVRIKRRLINRLDDAIELAQKRVEWNFKTAVPAFYPTKNTMSLLLPLDLTENEQPDVALVVELMESGAYIGQTILTMKMAYNNARLICRPDSDWLNTSLRLS